MIVYQEKGSVKKAITDDCIRQIRKENFHPMTYFMLDQGFLSDCVQIQVDFMGDDVWINVRMNELTHVGRKSMAGWMLHRGDFVSYVQPLERVTIDIIEHFQGTVPPEPTETQGPFFMVGEQMGESPTGPTYLTFAIDYTQGAGTFLGVFSKRQFRCELREHPEWLLNRWE